MSKVTLQDIARTCGVSTATVLRVVRNNGYVSALKRQRIEQAIARLGYVPKQTNRTAILPNAKIIAHFLHENAHPLFGRLSDGIGRYAMENGYSIITQHVDAHFSAVQITRIIDNLRAYNISGVIFNSLADTIDFMPIRRYLQTLPFPVVMIERVADIFHISKVLINAQEGLFLAVQHLVARGHRRIAFFNQGEDNPVERSRIDGFLRAADAYNLGNDAVLVSTDSYSFDEGYTALQRHLTIHPWPTAIVASDSLLVGMSQYLYENNIHVPRDMSLVGIDDTFAKVLSPKLSSIAFPEKEMCEMAVKLILEQSGKREGTSAKQILLSPYLVQRQSVAAPRTK
ncbi:MAG: LacI family transcriptional regulator [Clostridia bacterium]|nr:LacI family transcriptional regulator [Clostridia bacterium]